MEGPNNLIYKFEGNVKFQKTVEFQQPQSHGLLDFPTNSPRSVRSMIDDIATESLTNDNVALRGMSLKNTEFVIGCVVYTGHQTKIQMNSAKAVYKVSKMMKKTNTLIFWIFML